MAISDTIKKGSTRAPHRSLLRATGVIQSESDWDKPFIAVANAAGDTTVTVAENSSAASSALSALATAYNSTLTELNNNHGTSGGALSGQSIVLQLQQSLSDLLEYTGGSGSVQSLADLGLTFSPPGN